MPFIYESSCGQRNYLPSSPSYALTHSVYRKKKKIFHRHFHLFFAKKIESIFFNSLPIYFGLKKQVVVVVEFPCVGWEALAFFKSDS